MIEPRYTIFSVTGFTINKGGGTGGGARWRPRTTWYVTDNLDCGRVLDAFPTRYGAEKLRLALTVEDRAWEKRRERAIRANGNGR